MQKMGDSMLQLLLHDPVTHNECIYTYDHLHLKIYDDTHTLVNIDHLKPLVENIKIHDCKVHKSNKPHWKKCNDPRHIRITLGRDCNFRCKYCIQHHTDTENRDNITDADISIFKFLYSKYLDFSNIEMIQFWGGEPLLYKNTLLKATKALREIVPSDTKIFTLSNGSLWTEDFVDECLKLNLQLGLSHDGPGQCLRSADPLKENTSSRKAILKYWNSIKNMSDEDNYFSILCTATNESLKDLDATTKYFVDIFGDKIHGRYNFKCLIVENETQIPYMLDTSPKAKIPFKIFSYLFNTGISNNGFGLTIVDVLQMFLNENFSINDERVSCFLSSANILVTDLLGNVYPCQNYCTPDRCIGSIRDLENIVIPNYSVLKNHRTNCLKCPVVAMCMGGCPLVNYDYLSDNCKTQFVFNIGIFSYIVYLITGKVLMSIHGDFPCKDLT